MRLIEVTKKRKEKTLYVCRPLLNVNDIKKWAKDQGFEYCLPDDEFHVTIIHSKQKVEWEKTFPDNADLVVSKDKDHPRELCKFGKDKDVVVLIFYSKDLKIRHKEFLDIGCASDFPDYKAHISITYDGEDVDIAGMKPYEGELLFGPEQFDEISEDFKDSFEEQRL
jgi:hypothetical protein